MTAAQLIVSGFKSWTALNRLMQIELAKQGLTDAVMFINKRDISLPSELLYKSIWLLQVYIQTITR